MIEPITHFSGYMMVFAFYYPLFMAYIWMAGAMQYFLRWERHEHGMYLTAPTLDSYPAISLIVPCHNEGENVFETIEALINQQYPNKEVIAVNDGSSDNTGELLDQLAEKYRGLRVIHLVENQGKAMALKMGAMASPNEFLICVDGDALLDTNAATWMMRHFLRSPNVGAVTGNPRIRTRSTLLGKIQVGEFSSLIGLIKRAQRVYGRVFTISGVVAGFRKSALQSVDYWSVDAITEDIDVSWKLQMAKWDIRFEPNALCWILMPETLKGLWSQRLRWAQGGMEVVSRNLGELVRWRHRRMWLIVLEYLLSACWSYIIASLFLVWLVLLFMPRSESLSALQFLPETTSVVLVLTCLFQFGFSLFIDAKYERGVGKYYYWIIWFPLVYWMINVATTVAGIPKALFRRRGARATWISPDRGVRRNNDE